jgi:outer membrane protein
MLTDSRPNRRAMRTLALSVLMTACSYGMRSPGWISACHGQENRSNSRSNLLIPYEQRVASLEADRVQLAGRVPDWIPADFQPWWGRLLAQSLRDSTHRIPVDVQGLVMGAIRHSPKVMAISRIPEIRRTAVGEAMANFDVQTFVESKLTDTNDPVGSTLTTGGPTRYFDQNVYSNAGVRKKTLLGGQVELAQRLGYENSNSDYFIPPYQGTAKLALSYTQPLLRGAGRTYNESVIVLAEIDAGMAVDEFAGSLQDHVLELNRAYWALYLERVALLQKRELCREAEKILAELKARQRLDASQTQLVRAESAVAIRRANLIRAGTSVRNAEAKIQLLVNDPGLQVSERFELVPVQAPCQEFTGVGIRESVLTALHHRPDLDQAIKQIRAASVRADVASKELLPVLNAVITTYVSGLEGSGQIVKAYGDQFGNGGPSYSAGLEFEMPWGNRAAKARDQRRRLELGQYRYQLDQTVAQIVHDVEIAVREVGTGYRESQAKYRAMAASVVEIRSLQNRWRLLAGEEQVAGIMLGDLLSAQDRLAETEFEFAAAQVAYSLALVSLERATGTLMACRTRPEGSGSSDLAPPSVGPEALPTPLGIAPRPQTSSSQFPRPSLEGPASQQLVRLPPIKNSAK